MARWKRACSFVLCCRRPLSLVCASSVLLQMASVNVFSVEVVFSFYFLKLVSPVFIKVTMFYFFFFAIFP